MSDDDNMIGTRTGHLTGPNLAKALISTLGEIEGLNIETISAANWQIIEDAWESVRVKRIQALSLHRAGR